MTKTRRERIREETVREIKKIARRQLAEGGATAVSLRAIAREMGMSAPGLYSYFANYDELITALVIDVFNSMANALEAARDACDAGDHAGRFQAVVSTYRQWALEHRYEYLLIFGTPDINAPIEIIAPAAKRNWRVILEVLSAAAADDHLRIPSQFDEATPIYDQIQQEWRALYGIEVSVPVLHTAVKVWGLFHGLVMLELTQRQPEMLKQAHELELQLLMKDIGLV